MEVEVGFFFCPSANCAINTISNTAVTDITIRLLITTTPFARWNNSRFGQACEPYPKSLTEMVSTALLDVQKFVLSTEKWSLENWKKCILSCRVLRDFRWPITDRLLARIGQFSKGVEMK